MQTLAVAGFVALLLFSTTALMSALLRSFPPRSRLVRALSSHKTKATAKAPPTRLSSSSVEFTYKDLPPETLYVLDGTAMLFHAYFSRESSSPDLLEHAVFTDAFAQQLLNKLSPSQREAWNEYARGSTASTATAVNVDVDVDNDKVDTDDTGEEEEDNNGHLGVVSPLSDALSSSSPSSFSSSLPSSSTSSSTSSSSSPSASSRPSPPPRGDGSSMSCAALTVMALQFARFVREVRPSYVAVTFDVSRASLVRSALLPTYKQQRPTTPPDLFPQFLLAPAIFQAFGCRCLAQRGHEADDLMASVARWARDKGLSVALLSQDKDLLQLAGTGVHILHPRYLHVSGPDEVRAKYGVAPHQLPDLFALAGDAADNIKGARGIGVKIAAQLVAHFGSIATMYARLHLAHLPPLDLDKHLDSTSGKSKKTTTKSEKVEGEKESRAVNVENGDDDDDNGAERAEKPSDVQDRKTTTKKTKTKTASSSSSSSGVRVGKSDADRHLLLAHYARHDDDGTSGVSADEKLRLALDELAACPMRASPIKLLLALAELGEARALLYRQLVTLHDTLDWSKALLPLQHRQRMEEPAGEATSIEEELVSLLDTVPLPVSNVHHVDDIDDEAEVEATAYSSFFRFTGEFHDIALDGPGRPRTTIDMSRWLQGVSPALVRPLQILRQQYHHLQ